jgi:putative endonuclease
VRTPAQSEGDAAESIVATRLVAGGWRILARNARVGRQELDLVAVDPGPPAHLVIVEVRWRRSRRFGLAEETIDHRKRAHLRSAIGRLLADGSIGGMWLPSLPIRVDVVVVEPSDVVSARVGSTRIRHHRAIAL